jgi:RNA polymerase sigma factor (sigma-70 family)
MNLQELLQQARPRLMRIAQKQSLSPDDIEDIVQETMIEAWKHLSQLHKPESFDSWLNGICYNVCLRWNRFYAIKQQRTKPLNTVSLFENDAEEKVKDFPDPQLFDPMENLIQQDLATLLDQALAYLSPITREALELFYIDDLSQEEIAARSGITVGALKVRLHRARHQLWQIFHTEMRTQAQQFGLILDAEGNREWRKTSIWCFLCGRYRAEGRFETTPEGKSVFRLRCPVCETHGIRLVDSGGVISLEGLHSFRPLYKRMIQEIPAFFKLAIESGDRPCPACHGKAEFRGIESRSSRSPDIPPLLYVLLQCTHCTSFTPTTAVASLYMDHLIVQHFFKEHPQAYIAQNHFTIYSGQQAISLAFADRLSSAEIILFVHPQTLKIVGNSLGKQ